MLLVDEVVNAIECLGEDLEEYVVVKKLLRSLPKSYSSKVSSIEEARDSVKISIDQLNRDLIAFEMREFNKEGPKNEETFKESKKETYEEIDLDSDTDEDEEIFLRRLKRGTNK